MDKIPHLPRSNLSRVIFAQSSSKSQHSCLTAQRGLLPLQIGIKQLEKQRSEISYFGNREVKPYNLVGYTRVRVKFHGSCNAWIGRRRHLSWRMHLIYNLRLRIMHCLILRWYRLQCLHIIGLLTVHRRRSTNIARMKCQFTCLRNRWQRWQSELSVVTRRGRCPRLERTTTIIHL